MRLPIDLPDLTANTMV